MRLNGVMALIAVVCVVGVVSGELLGPMAQLRNAGRVGDDATFAKKPAWRAEIADDTFQFPPDQPLALEILGPTIAAPGDSLGRYLPSPVFSAVTVLFDHPPDGQEPVTLVSFLPTVAV